MKPLVSVIVPIYNVEKYLEKCIDSIINQTLKEIEIILIDDGSTDNCPRIIDEYAKRESCDSLLNVSLFQQTVNCTAERRTRLWQATAHGFLFQQCHHG